jgi:hypothetical protein
MASGIDLNLEAWAYVIFKHCETYLGIVWVTPWVSPQKRKVAEAT